jgi:hypothetical protein
MAITQDYVSTVGIEGNDYKGASFTDGAFTHATLTLTKAGAFADTSIGHWLYLTDNGSGEVTAGYYRVTNIGGAPNSVVLHADIRSGVNDPVDVVCTQHAGTALLPWRSLQGAFDLLTRNAADGNQVNLKAGTAHVNDAALDLDEVIAGGALGGAAPLIVRGYTAAANDGGIGEIDCNGVTTWAAATYDYVMLVDLYIHGNLNVSMMRLRNNCLVYHCEVYNGGGAVDSYIELESYGAVINCYVHGLNTGTGIVIAGQGLILGNYVVQGTSMACGIASGVGSIMHNIILASLAAAVGIYQTNGSFGLNVIGNIIYNTEAGTGSGILLGNAAAEWGGVVANNIICGFSGVGGNAIENTADMHCVGYNAFWNNTANYELTDQTYVDLTANDVALGADPFTDAANGDFSLTAAAQAALADKGFPIAYYGAHANTVPHLNIGPIQMAEADYPAEGDVESGVVYGSGAYTGDFDVPAEADVRLDTAYGDDGEFVGTLVPGEELPLGDTATYLRRRR